VIDVRFRERAEVRGAGRNLTAARRFEERLRALVERVGAGEIEPLVPGVSQEKLDRIAGRARRAAGPTPNLASWYRLTLPHGTDVSRAVARLERSSLVEVAAPVPERAPVPATPDFSAEQLYLDPAPVGTDAEFTLADPRTRGAGVRIVDVEYAWIENHEDLMLPPSFDFGEGEFVEDLWSSGNEDHGTAVVGIMSARDNGFGVTGGVPDASIHGLSPTTSDDVYNLGGALGFLLDKVGPGDVVLVEQQVWGPELEYVPAEWEQPVFDAIKALSNKGAVVVEAGANGGRNLDHVVMLGRFDRSVRDSDAILVASGTASRAPTATTSRGSRLDLQGHGVGVVTTGYGTRQGGDPTVRYSNTFNATSAASPIVVNAVVAILSYLKATGQQPLSADELVALLRETGTPQTGSGQIGPLPDAAAALRKIEVDPPSVHAERIGDSVTIAADDGWGRGVETIEYRIDDGAWATYDAPLGAAGVGKVAYRATDLNGNTSEPRTLVVTPEAIEPEPDLTPPETRIKVKRKKVFTRGKRPAKVRATIEASEVGSTLRCRVDKKPWSECDSPVTFRLKRGGHKLWAYAVDPAGNADPTPAKVKVKVKRRR